MWTPCPKILDRPVLILGMEIEDLAVVAGALLLLGMFLPAWLAFLGAGLTWVLLWEGKRGQPPGTLLHQAHRWGVLPIKGVLRGRGRYSPWP